jgi:hypothetical protein
LSQQASWEYDLAMCDLEAGSPDEAAVHFTKALTLAPDLAVRPIAAYYLGKMGKPVPPPIKRDGATVKPADSAPDLSLGAGIVGQGRTGQPLPPPDSAQALKPSPQPTAPKDAAKTAAPATPSAKGAEPK